MFLKSMELFGFKSFAEKTLVEFEPGITAIVGSNGCGKSNIVDAIKWVVGEKQARNLRGNQMADIIFSGTELRKPLSMAEVTVTIDNANRLLDFDSDFVTVGRRIFRDGESEYLINKSPVRLKDIEKLFMDTGIGKSSYSVMEQGQMDMILSKRAEDRRYIFEEAAGISKFKLQKKDSLRRLEETRENLSRINDIIKELERQKDVKAKQAEKTREYRALREKLKEFDTKLSIIRFREFDKKLSRINEDIARLTAEKDKISARVAATSAENETDEENLNNIRSKLWELDKKLENYKLRTEDLDGRTKRNRDSVSEQQERRAAVEKKIAAVIEKKKGLAAEKETTEASSASVKKKIQEDTEARQQSFERRKAKMEAIRQARDDIEKNRESVKEHETAQGRLREELEIVIRQLIQAIDRRKAELQNSEDQRQQVRSEFHGLLEKADESLSAVRKFLSDGLIEDALDALKTVDMSVIRDAVGRFESFEDGFRSILFDKTGIHARKEALDRQIQEHADSIAGLRKANTDLEAVIIREQAELEAVNDMISRIEKDLSKYEIDIEWMTRKLQDLNVQMKDADMQLEGQNEDIARIDRNIRQLLSEIDEWNKRLVEYSEKSTAFLKEQKELSESQEDIIKKIRDRKNVSLKDEEALEKIIRRITDLDKSTVEYELNKNRIEEYLWTEYEKKVSDMSGYSPSEAVIPELTEGLQAVKKQIQPLQQQVNPLAIDEFNDVKKRFDYYIDQRKDIEKAREDILSVIDDINKTSVTMFLDTFKEIQKNFSQIFKRLFEGGDAAIELLNPDDVLDSGIEINVRPPGKKPKSIGELSGGERAMTAVSLLFATYMVKPSPFCFLDEIDAPFDETNIGRFIKMVREFSKNTQFIIISHNKKTMRVCESIYGVTMEERGVSKVISMKMSGIETEDSL